MPSTTMAKLIGHQIQLTSDDSVPSRLEASSTGIRVRVVEHVSQSCRDRV